MGKLPSLLCSKYLINASSFFHDFGLQTTQAFWSEFTDNLLNLPNICNPARYVLGYLEESDVPNCTKLLLH